MPGGFEDSRGLFLLVGLARGARLVRGGFAHRVIQGDWGADTGLPLPKFKGPKEAIMGTDNRLLR